MTHLIFFETSGRSKVSCRIRRILHIFVVALCALLLGGTLVDYAHSINNSETLVLCRGDTLYAVDNVSGQISFWRGFKRDDRQHNIDDGFYWEHWEYPHMQSAQQFSVINPAGEDLWLLGFALTTQRRFPSTVETLSSSEIDRVAGVVIPLWFPAAVFAFVPLRALLKLRTRTTRQIEGRCLNCGYDLRASSNVCPECGMPIESGSHEVTKTPSTHEANSF